MELPSTSSESVASTRGSDDADPREQNRGRWIGQSQGPLRSARIRIALLVAAVAGAIIGVLCAAAYDVGRRIDPEVRFLDPQRSPTLNEAVMAFAIEYALQSHEPNDVVFLGDSTSAFDIDPVRLERLTGLRTYNLGTMGALGPLGFLVTLQAYLKHHPKPRLVVLCLWPFLMEVEVQARDGDVAPRFIENYGPEVQGVVPFHQSLAYFVKRGAESWGTQRDPRTDSLQYMEHETYLTLKQKFLDGRGFHALSGEHGEPRDVARPGPPKLIREDWDVGLRRIAQACEDADVPLLIRFTPVSATVADARDFSPLEGWAKGFREAHPKVRIVGPLPLTIYAPQFVYDNVHLNAAGVDKFMPVVAKDVQSVLGK
jgi:hypothetical protein